MIKIKNVKRYCCEDISKIENYDKAIADKSQTWHCHHRLEVQGQFRNTPLLLKKLGLYYNVPAQHLIFLTKADHIKVHRLNVFTTDETKKKIALANHYRHPSESTKRKTSLAMKRHHRTEEHCNNISISKRGEKNPVYGKKCYNNGIINVFAKECPEGFVKGRLKSKYLSNDASSPSK